MIVDFSEETRLVFSVTPPLYTPYFNKWGANAYYRYEPFSNDPFGLRASSTSGSPVVLAGSSFFGFMNDGAEGRFEYDGCGRLTVVCSAGQRLWYNERCEPFAEWEHYNEAVSRGWERQEDESFWSGLEYCTWVDQKHVAAVKGSKDVFAPLSESYVYEYMKRVKRLGLPVGKLTVDDGWYVRVGDDGRPLYGDWEIDREKFPNFERMVRDMKEEGFTPGLWFAPFTFTPNSVLAKKRPELIGLTFSENAENEESRRLMFIKPSPELDEYYKSIFTPYIQMGFRKLKLDMSYGPKRDMKLLLAAMRRAVKSVDASVEIEAHIPDIFVSRYCDTVRINDVAFDNEGRWRGVTWEHYKVCRGSARGKILNLDHLGTNTPVPKAEQFLEHSKMLLGLDGGYPCVSLLPDCFDTKTSEEFCNGVKSWAERSRT